MGRAQSLESLTQSQKLKYGGLFASIGLFTAWLVYSQPHRLRAPSELAYLACACFVVAGLAVAAHGAISKKAYAWMMAMLMGMLTAIPAWVAFGAGPRQCRSLVVMFADEAGCRSAFGLAAILMFLATLLACKMAWKTGRNP